MLRPSQKVFRWIALWPSSSYSLFDTHIFLKVSRDDRMLPPIQVEYNRSCGAEILILISLGASFLTSDKRRSPKPLNNVEPPVDKNEKNICFKPRVVTATSRFLQVYYFIVFLWNLEARKFNVFSETGIFNTRHMF